MIETIGRPNSKREINDYYATPPKEVENILAKEKLFGTILENSCGEGHIVEVIKKMYPKNKVIATDLIDRGYGETGLDFLAEDYPYTDVDCIIMNPPFKHINEFVEKSLNIADKVILLARLQFLESKSRFKKIFSKNKPNRIYIYVDRISCAINGDFSIKDKNSMAFAWFVWDKNDPEIKIEWLRKAKE